VCLGEGNLRKRKRAEELTKQTPPPGVRSMITQQVGVGSRNLTIGIVGKTTLFWRWITEGLGKVTWTCSKQQEGKERDLWQKDEISYGFGTPLAEVLGRHHTDVILLEDWAPTPGGDIWKNTRVRMIIGYKKMRGRPPPSWHFERFNWGHARVGGCTTLRGKFWVACRSTEMMDCFRQAELVGIPGGLHRVINPTIPGIPSTGPSESERKLLDDPISSQMILLKDDCQRMKVPSVFSKSGYCRRKLATEEKLAALDLPIPVNKHSTEAQRLEWLRHLRLPFKFRSKILLIAGQALSGKPTKERLGEESISRKRKGIEQTNQARKEQNVRPDRLVERDAEDEKMENAKLCDVDRIQKATKDDDAEVPVHLWNDRILRLEWLGKRSSCICAIEIMRKRMLAKWKSIVKNDWWNWWGKYKARCKEKGQEPSRKIGIAGAIAVGHAMEASWWDWDNGSAPFFWRWPEEFMANIRDGIPPRFIGPPPRYKKPQTPNPDAEHLKLEKKKIGKVRQRGYIAPLVGIMSLMYFFSVTKGLTDIRMVYDGTSCGLNEVLFAPWFALPTVDAMLRSVDTDYYGADNDYGEMFLNFWLHEDLRNLCGVDLTHVFGEELEESKRTVLWEAWCRCAMGLKPSPYQACQGGLQAKEIALGHPKDDNNVFRWERVVLNLPGNLDYDPSKPWVYKIRKDGKIAADIHGYVDDNRETAPTEEEAWLASSRMAKTCAYLGLQDAARKRREPKRNPGAWAGAVVEATKEGVYKGVTQERWDKTRKHIKRLGEWAEGNEKIPRKELESIRGFLVYVSLTYTIMVPYLKGIHMTLESWRPNRDEEGWKLTSVPASVWSKGQLEDHHYDWRAAPETVAKVPRFRDDIGALQALTDYATPPKIRVRPGAQAEIQFHFGDASGSGFGMSVWVQGSDTVEATHGEWKEVLRMKSSNHREFYNLAMKIETMVKEGVIPEGTEIFMFTDNMVTERAFFKGTSTNRELYAMVLMLRKLEMEGKLFLNIIWIAGTRMIEQGTDGLSRGDLSNGVMIGHPMLQYVPLNKSATTRQPNLLSWLIGTHPKGWTAITPSDWYFNGHKIKRALWLPPPAAADAALEQLCESFHKRPNQSHMFVCPAIMSCRWRKKLGKIADVVFTLPVGTVLWGKEQHEPVIIGLTCPLLNCSPWQVRKCDELVERLVQDLQGMWSADLIQNRDRLRKFWVHTGGRAAL
jgi:hypothetical protein